MRRVATWVVSRGHRGFGLGRGGLNVGRRAEPAAPPPPPPPPSQPAAAHVVVPVVGRTKPEDLFGDDDAATDALAVEAGGDDADFSLTDDVAPADALDGLDAAVAEAARRRADAAALGAVLGAPSAVAPQPAAHGDLATWRRVLEADSDVATGEPLDLDDAAPAAIPAPAGAEGRGGLGAGGLAQDVREMSLGWDAAAGRDDGDEEEPADDDAADEDDDRPAGGADGAAAALADGLTATVESLVMRSSEEDTVGESLEGRGTPKWGRGPK